MVGKVVFDGKTKNNRDFLLRYPKTGDAEKMCNYINTLSLEKTFITFQGEQKTLEEETEYLHKQLEAIEKKQCVQLLAFSGNKLIGISEITLGERVCSHVGLLGISIAKEFRGEGVGTTLMAHILEEAITELPGLKIITLSVFGNNSLAREMYKKFGFLEYGSLPEGVIHRDQLVDSVYMYKNIG